MSSCITPRWYRIAISALKKMITGRPLAAKAKGNPQPPSAKLPSERLPKTIATPGCAIWISRWTNWAMASKKATPTLVLMQNSASTSWSARPPTTTRTGNRRLWSERSQAAARKKEMPRRARATAMGAA